MSADPAFFEGSEKLLEIWWHTPPKLTALLGDNYNNGDLRRIPRKKIEDFLDLASCKILSVIENPEMTAYLLSESSLYISRDRLILKTCGVTALLNAMFSILKEAEQECGLTDVKYLFYSRKSFSQPDLQRSPHRNFQQEFSVLDQFFPGGDAYTLGRRNSSRCWHLFTVDNYSDDGLQNPDQTLEILMNDLEPAILHQYYHGYCEKPADLTKELGITELIPGAKIDDFVFEPCGYSVNGILEDIYFTIHVTPQTKFSYASFETNIKSSSYENLIKKVLGIFQPGKFVMTLFANAVAPCGQSMRTFERNFKPYKRIDLHFASLKNYNVTYGYYELA